MNSGSWRGRCVWCASVRQLRTFAASAQSAFAIAASSTWWAESGLSLQLRSLKGDPAKAAIRREYEPKNAAFVPMTAKSPKHATLQYAPRYEISCNAVILGRVLRLRMMNSCDRNVSSSIWRNYCSGCVDVLSARFQASLWADREGGMVAEVTKAG